MLVLSIRLNADPMTNARLRRTFRYPAWASSESDDALDEQEQESLIVRLAARNAARDARFCRLLLALPLLAALPCLQQLVRPPSPRALLPALLALSSLLATGFMLLRLPPRSTGLAPLDARSGSVACTSPLDTYLPSLNAGLSALLTLAGLVSNRAAAGTSVATLPALVYFAVTVAKLFMAGVDPERELSALKYEYKGA